MAFDFTVDTSSTNGGSHDTTVVDNTTSATLFLSQTSGGVPVWKAVPGAGVAAYLFQTANSDISGLKSAVGLGLYTPGVIQTTFTTAVADGTNLITFATASGLPNLVLLPAGQILVCINATTSLPTKPCALYATISKYSVGGVETVIATTGLSDQLTSTMSNHNMYATVNDIDLLATDRLICRLYLYSPGFTPDINLHIDGQTTLTTNARMQIPAAGLDASKYLPYTGALQSLTLGTNSVSAAFLQLTPSAARPTGATEGAIWAKTDHSLYYFNGTTDVKLDNAP